MQSYSFKINIYSADKELDLIIVNNRSSLYLLLLNLFKILIKYCLFYINNRYSIYFINISLIFYSI